MIRFGIGVSTSMSSEREVEKEEVEEQGRGGRVRREVEGWKEERGRETRRTY